MLIDALFQTRTDSSGGPQVSQSQKNSGASFVEVMNRQLSTSRSQAQASKAQVAGQTAQPEPKPEQTVQPTGQEPAAKQEAATTGQVKQDKVEAPVEEQKEGKEEETTEAALTAAQLLLLMELLLNPNQQEEASPEVKELLGKLQGLLEQLPLLEQGQLQQLSKELQALLTQVARQAENPGIAASATQFAELLAELQPEEAETVLQEVVQLLKEVPVKEHMTLLQTVSGQQSGRAEAQKAEADSTDEGLDVTLKASEGLTVQKTVEEKTANQSLSQEKQDSTEKGGTEGKPLTENLVQNLVSFEKLAARPVEAQLETQTLEAQELIQQIVEKASVVLKEGKTEMKLQLTPDHLGSLVVEVSMEKGNLTAKLITETVHVKELLQNNLDQLKIVLGEKGIEVSGLEVSVDQHSQQTDQQQTYYQYQQQVKNLAYNRSNIAPIGSVVYQAGEQQSSNPYWVTSQFDAMA